MKIVFALIVCSGLFATTGAFVSVAPAKQSTGSVLFYDTKGDSHRHVEKHHDVLSKVAEWVEQQISRLEPRDVMPKDDISEWLSDAFTEQDPISDNWFDYAVTQKPPASLKGLQIQDNDEALLNRKSFQGLSPEAPKTGSLPIGSIKNFHLEPTAQKTLSKLSATHLDQEELGDGMWFSRASPASVHKNLLGANDCQVKPGCSEWFALALNQ